MKRSSLTLLFVLLSVLLIVGGCGNPAAQVGSVSFKVDLSGLTRASATVEITRVAVTLTRDDYDPVARDLQIAGSAANGQISGLATGYWHIAAIMEDSNGLTYKGESDVGVEPYTTTPCEIYFDPDPINPQTGDLTITVGWNPLPGYTLVSYQTTPATFINEPANRLYIYDPVKAVLSVYDATNMHRLNGLQLPRDPVTGAQPAITQNYDRSRFLLGVSGELRELNPETGVIQNVTTIQLTYNRIISCAANLIVFANLQYGSCQLNSFDLATGQVVGTAQLPYDVYDLVYNPAVRTIYFTTASNGLGRVRLDASGQLSQPTTVPYTSTMGFYLIDKGTKLALSTGDFFTSSNNDSDDLINIAYVGPFNGLAWDENSAYFYKLPIMDMKLQVVRQSDRTVRSEIPLSGMMSQAVYCTPSNIVVIVYDGSRYFGKSFSKSSLGL